MFDIHPLILDPTHLTDQVMPLTNNLKRATDILDAEARAVAPTGFSFKNVGPATISYNTLLMARSADPKDHIAVGAPHQQIRLIDEETQRLGKLSGAVEALGMIGGSQRDLAKFAAGIFSALRSAIFPVAPLVSKDGDVWRTAMTANLMTFYRFRPQMDRKANPLDYTFFGGSMAPEIRAKIETAGIGDTDLVLPVFLYRAKSLTAHERMEQIPTLDAELAVLEGLAFKRGAGDIQAQLVIR